MKRTLKNFIKIINRLSYSIGKDIPGEDDETRAINHAIEKFGYMLCEIGCKPEKFKEAEKKSDCIKCIDQTVEGVYVDESDN